MKERDEKPMSHQDSIAQVIAGSDDNDWLGRASCEDMDLNEFFVEAGRTIKQDTINICKGCPVRRECVSHSYANGLTAGYFGGISPGQRRSLDLVGAMAVVDADELKVRPARSR